MSEDRGSIADMMYPHLARGEDGSLGENGADTARNIIESGVARSAEAPPHRQERAAAPDPRIKSGDGAQPAPPVPFDAAKYTAPQGFDGDLTEFGREAKALGISQEAGQRLVDLHVRTVKANEDAHLARLNGNIERLQRELPAEDIAMVNRLLADPDMTPAPMKAWIERWGAHEDLARMLTSWAGAIRRGRY